MCLFFVVEIISPEMVCACVLLWMTRMLVVTFSLSLSLSLTRSIHGKVVGAMFEKGRAAITPPPRVAPFDRRIGGAPGRDFFFADKFFGLQ